jgi:excinuclease ABC subunit B
VKKFILDSEFTPQGDQSKAIGDLVRGVRSGARHQVLLGVTGSGKTFTVANVIEGLQRPTLVISHNKTLAAQLFNEFRSFFPGNAVEYFVSYYDYYQPEAYLPQTDTYIEKDSAINEEIDKLRHSATRSVLERRDVIIVASVSCIYGLGAPDYYRDMKIILALGTSLGRQNLLRDLVGVHYRRNDLDFSRGTFRVRGDVVEVFPAYEEEKILRVEFFGETVERLTWRDPLTGRCMETVDEATIFPGSHYVIPEEVVDDALGGIEQELQERLQWFRERDKLLEAQRLEQRTKLDMEMIREVGFCPGIENYSRHLTGRTAGSPPPTLMEYFPDDLLVVIDESHVTVPQVKAMEAGDRSRKKNLVDHGFRLPSAYDNRPLKFEEFEERVGQAVYVSATPGPYETEKAGARVVEQIIRPTGLTEPEVEIRPTARQVEDLMEEVRVKAERGERVLVTTLTKRMAEDLTEYYTELGIKVRYLHSEIHTLERMQVLRDLRRGVFDVLIGINLLREGLDLPEVSLVAVLDADKEGFLRSETALVQTAGRAARNVDGRVILYADVVTGSIRRAMKETERRRLIQSEYNRREGITPEGIKKDIDDVLASIYEADYAPVPSAAEGAEEYVSLEEAEARIMQMEEAMKEAASKLDFEKAAELRDRVRELRRREVLPGTAGTVRRHREAKRKKGSGKKGRKT